MATFRFTNSISNLRRDVIDDLGPGNSFQDFAYSIREIAASVLRGIPALRGTESIDNLDVSITLGTEPFEDGSNPADTVGSMRLAISVDVPDQMVNDVDQVDAPLHLFIEGLGQALTEAAFSLPNNGADFFASIGLTDPSTQVSNRVEVDVVPPRRR